MLLPIPAAVYSGRLQVAAPVTGSLPHSAVPESVLAMGTQPLPRPSYCKRLRSEPVHESAPSASKNKYLKGKEDINTSLLVVVRIRKTCKYNENIFKRLDLISTYNVHIHTRNTGAFKSSVEKVFFFFLHELFKTPYNRNHPPFKYK